MVRQTDQNNEAEATKQAKQTEPLWMALALGVIHATPNEEHHADQNEDQP